MAKWQNLKNQILAGTLEDSQGERNTKEFLHSLCKSFNAKGRMPLNQQHDMSLEPVGYIENFKVVESVSSEDEWYLIGDVYFHDVDINEALRGFSFSVTEDIRGDIDNKLLSVYLPFPLYNDQSLINNLLGSGEGVVIGAWRKKAATPDQIALIISFALFVASPAYTNFWNNTISPLFDRLLRNIGTEKSFDYVQTAHGHLGETFGIYFIPVRGNENYCFTFEKVLQGMDLVDAYLANDNMAKSKGIHLMKLIFSETTNTFELKLIEYQDGSIINNPL